MRERALLVTLRHIARAMRSLDRGDRGDEVGLRSVHRGLIAASDALVAHLDRESGGLGKGHDA